MPKTVRHDWTLDTRSGSRSPDDAHRVWECYRQVFDDAPDLDSWTAGTFEPHARREGYRLVLAGAGDRLIGFAWGYVGSPGQYWTDLAASALPPDVASAWLGGHFEFVELGVLPDRRGEGIGRALHDALLEGVDRRSLLSTADDVDDPAVHLYRSAGWRRLGTLAPGVQVMGLDPR